MELKTIRQVSQDYGISRQMLCYYERIGLLSSTRKDDYAYRVYDEAAIVRLRQIIILRKLRVPVRQIRAIFDNSDAASVIEIFERSIRELDEEITVLSTVRSILGSLVQELHDRANVCLQLDLLGDSSVFAVVDCIPLSKNRLQEEISMNDLNKADESLNKLKDGDVRIVHVPPMTVAAYRATGEFEWGAGPEAVSKIEQFVFETGLLQIKPDARAMGFDCSEVNLKVRAGVSPTAYEAWVSIPDDMDVKSPLTKKTFGGGIYAAHVLRDWNFKRDWQLLMEWANASEKYKYAEGQPCFEEKLNYYTSMQNGAPHMDDVQLDLLLPVKLRAV